MKLCGNDTVALIEIWTSIKSYVPVKDQRSCAEQFISIIDDTGLIDLSIEGTDLYGTCDIFDKALRTYCDENGLTNESLEDWDE
jgi:hypothetical protein